MELSRREYEEFGGKNERRFQRLEKSAKQVEKIISPESAQEAELLNQLVNAKPNVDISTLLCRN